MLHSQKGKCRESMSNDFERKTAKKSKIIDYPKKFESYGGRTRYETYSPDQQGFLREIAFKYFLTFQEFREIVEADRDLTMWGEGGLQTWWNSQTFRFNGADRQAKDQFISRLRQFLDNLRNTQKAYPEEGLPKPSMRESKKIVSEKSDKKILGMCPVASEKTVCCNLRTIDAVESCVFGCSYCTIQTFYGDKVVFDEEFGEKLKAISLEPNRFYHIGTGQASDSLAFGNRNGILDDLCHFAESHPDILLEFKTKSNNIRYFLDHDIPPNCVCSWSLNTETIINNEEHFTANLNQRLTAARDVADKGVKVAFHFHPMVYYQGWDVDYPDTVSMLLKLFSPEEVLFVSFGTLTFIKPVIQKIRELGQFTKILQMDLVPDPHGKLTYPDDIKVKMFNEILQAITPWRDKVFMYLCMEKASIWEGTFGSVYDTNEEFEQDFGEKTMCKLRFQHVIA